MRIGVAEGFENPSYAEEEDARRRLGKAGRLGQVRFDNRSVMDIYESILDFNSAAAAAKPPHKYDEMRSGNAAGATAFKLTTNNW